MHVLYVLLVVSMCRLEAGCEFSSVKVTHEPAVHLRPRLCLVAGRGTGWEVQCAVDVPSLQLLARGYACVAQESLLGIEVTPTSFDNGEHLIHRPRMLDSIW